MTTPTTPPTIPNTTIIMSFITTATELVFLYRMM